MRPRKREAVSGLLFQIGSSTRTTCSVSTRATSILPITGSAYMASVLTHCSACLAFFHPARCDSMYCAAHQANVTALACSARVVAKASCLTFIGSMPSRTCLRHAMALSRASASETSGTAQAPSNARARPSCSAGSRILSPFGDLQPQPCTITMHASNLDSAGLQLRQFIRFHHTFKFDGNWRPILLSLYGIVYGKTEYCAMHNEST